MDRAEGKVRGRKVGEAKGLVGLAGIDRPQIGQGEKVQGTQSRVRGY